MRSELLDERNDIQIEFAESSDTSGFYEITNNAIDCKDQVQTLIVQSQQQHSAGRLRRTSRRTEPVRIFLILFIHIITF